MPSFSLTLRKEFFSFPLIFGSLVMAFLYITLSVVLLNIKLFSSLIAQQVSPSELILLFFSLIGGLWTGLSRVDFFLTITTALLVGINTMLLVRTIYVFEHKGRLRLSIGGAALFSLAVTGCASCGLSILSVLGLSASLSFLPFDGIELHISAVILLGVSTIYMVKQLHNGIYCKLPQDSKKSLRA